MATTQTVDLFSTPDLSTLTSYRRMGLFNGLFIGFTIVLVFWLPKVLVMARLPLKSPNVGAVLSSVVVVLLCALTGWLTSRLAKVIFSVLAWLVTAVLTTMSQGYLTLLGQNWVLWLSDSRFQGLFITPVPAIGLWWRFAVGGYLLIIALIVFAIMEPYRLERAHVELGGSKRLSRRSLLILLTPMLFIGLVTSLIPDQFGNAPREALQLVHDGIQGARDFEGDLFQLSLESGLNYNALRGVQEQIHGPYTLAVGEIETAGIISVVADFENGAWINCQVNADELNAIYLSFCADASVPYTRGFASLITGEPLPAECLRCTPEAEAAWQSWLQDRNDRFAGEPQIERVAQQGSYVIMQASSPDSAYVIECWFQGIRLVHLQKCTEVK